MSQHLDQATGAPGFGWSANPGHGAAPFPDKGTALDSASMQQALEQIRAWPAYAPTALHDLPEIAARLGLGRVLYKDESSRFGLASFKALGGAYAVARLARDALAAGLSIADLTVTTATDGNHGRSVAWGASRAGCRARIYIHAQVSLARQAAMEALGAEVTRVAGNYEASLAACRKDAARHGWRIVSDTSWPGYHEVPRQVMAGYTVMGAEILQQLGDTRPTHAMLPVGVGGLAAAVIAPLWQACGTRLGRMISVESENACCLRNSIAAGHPRPFEIDRETLMAGLSCGEVSDLAWKTLQQTLSHCITLGDGAVEPLMRWFHSRPVSIEAGECATSGLAALLQAHQHPDAWQSMGFNSDSVVLLLGTEGATDPDFYARTIATA